MFEIIGIMAVAILVALVVSYIGIIIVASTGNIEFMACGAIVLIVLLSAFAVTLALWVGTKLV